MSFSAWRRCPLSARAEDCPDKVPAASRERRALAKDWFSRAESADAANDPIGALKAYQCSLKMVPHAFTAFNLGRLAERTGDLELAVEAFNTYLKLAPEAPDRTQIRSQDRGAGRHDRGAAGRASRPTGRGAAPAKPPISEPPLDLKPAPPAEPNADRSARHHTRDVQPSLTTLAPWIIGGVGVAALAAGIA